MSEVTRILSAVEQGEPSAAEQLCRWSTMSCASWRPRGWPTRSPARRSQATALVHEAYLRLVGGEQARHWDGRGHFFAAAAEAMRRILIDRARHKQAIKAGGGPPRGSTRRPRAGPGGGERRTTARPGRGAPAARSEDPRRPRWSSSAFSPASPPSRRPPRWASRPPPPRRTGRTPGAGSGLVDRPHDPAAGVDT